MLTYPNKRLSLFMRNTVLSQSVLAVGGILCTSSHCFVSCGEDDTVTDAMPCGCTPCNISTRAVWKVRGLTLFWVGTLWRCGDGLFFEVPPLASDAILTTLHPLLKNVLQTVDHFEISCLGAPFSWLEKARNLNCMADVLMGSHWSTFSKPNAEFNSDLAPCDFSHFEGGTQTEGFR
jgi:hypothetical protein